MYTILFSTFSHSVPSWWNGRIAKNNNNINVTTIARTKSLLEQNIQRKTESTNTHFKKMDDVFKLQIHGTSI